jgi:choice-of-anchor A domain-containing protein
MRFYRHFPALLAGVLFLATATQAPASMLAGTDALNEWNLIVFNNLDSNSEVEGRTFVGGNLTGSSSNYNIGPASSPNNGSQPALTVVGDVTGSSKQLNNGGGASIGGNLATQLNLNGANQTVNVGGSITTQQNVNQNTETGNLGANFTQTLNNQKTLLMSSLGSLSDNLKALASTGTATISNNQLSLTGASSGISVFNLSLSNLASLNNISVTAPSGGTTVINVSGTSGTINANFNSSAELGRNVIWNFYDATSLTFANNFLGTVLATDAAVANTAGYIEGTLVANSFTQRAEVHQDTFQGDLSSVGGSVSAMPEPGTWAMLILGFGAIGFMQRRKRPVATAAAVA